MKVHAWNIDPNDTENKKNTVRFPYYLDIKTSEALNTNTQMTQKKWRYQSNIDLCVKFQKRVLQLFGVRPYKYHKKYETPIIDTQIALIIIIKKEKKEDTKVQTNTVTYLRVKAFSFKGNRKLWNDGFVNIRNANNPMSGEITCCDVSVFSFLFFQVYSIGSSNMIMGHLPAVLSFVNWFVSQTQRGHL